MSEDEDMELLRKMNNDVVQMKDFTEKWLNGYLYSQGMLPNGWKVQLVKVNHV